MPSDTYVEPTHEDEEVLFQPRNPRPWKKVAASVAAVASIVVIIGGVLVFTGKRDQRTISASANENVLSEANANSDASNDRAVVTMEDWIVSTIDAVPEGPTKRPSFFPTANPVAQPSAVAVAAIPESTPAPTLRPTSMNMAASTPPPTPLPTLPPLTANPTTEPTGIPTPMPQSSNLNSNGNPACFTNSLYDAIDADIALLKSTIADSIERSHFLGSIVRLAAHDFMDYDRFSSVPYGPDGCFDPEHDANAGLPEGVWCQDCLLRGLYETKYPYLSRADFWIASANAVIRQTSVNNALDLRSTFTWGRVDLDSCPGSGDRVPSPDACSEVEEVFLNRMGLEWFDAVALLGAHSIGRGDADFSGHDGVWSDGADDAQIFDKGYYEAIFNNAWQPRNVGQTNQDFTIAFSDAENPRMMLHTDICLVYDIDRMNNMCCTREGECVDGRVRAPDDKLTQCPFYDTSSSRINAYYAVWNMINGSTDSSYFYSAFTNAWAKATNVGFTSPYTLSDTCDSGNSILFE